MSVEDTEISYIGIEISGEECFQCPVGWTVAQAEKKMRSTLDVTGGCLTRNNMVLSDAYVITDDGAMYGFILFNSNQRE